MAPLELAGHDLRDRYHGWIEATDGQPGIRRIGVGIKDFEITFLAGVLLQVPGDLLGGVIARRR